ncbi:MFS transporter [Sphingobium amiense]|uniref:MFS transporter n=1 Tax=Sphingobium amiense TaxID=135719 RepID=A0A494W0T2_9SPHN|nr:MFS transporter [Sphingobium amiense]BBD96788.1 MFS transporter [Sphingobium amiense]
MTTGNEPFAQTLPRSVSYTAYVIVLLWIANIINYTDRYALAMLLPAIKKDMLLSDTQLGMLVGFGFALFYAICGIPVARLADAGNRRNIITAGLVVWSAMTAACGLALNFWHLLLARVGVGAGEACCMPPSQSLICDYVPRRWRSPVLAFHQSGLFIGMMVSMALAGWLGSVIGWRLAFAVIGLPGVVLGLLILLTVREPERGRLDGHVQPKAAVGFGEALLSLLRVRPYVFIVGFYIAHGFVTQSLNQWWPSYYVRVLGAAPAAIGLPLELAIGVGSSLGLLAGGILSSRFADRGLKWPLMIGGVLAIGTVPLAAVALTTGSLATSLIAVTCINMLINISVGPALASLYNVTSPSIRGLAGSLPIFFAATLGFGFGPFLVGFFSDLLAQDYGQLSLRYAMITPVAALPLITVALCGTALTLPAETPSGSPTEA